MFSTQLRLNLNSRKKYRPQTDDETLLADKTDYVWDPDWSHMQFFNISNDISRAAIATISVHKDFLRVIPITTDTTPLN